MTQVAEEQRTWHQHMKRLGLAHITKDLNWNLKIGSYEERK